MNKGGPANLSGAISGLRKGIQKPEEMLKNRMGGFVGTRKRAREGNCSKGIEEGYKQKRMQRNGPKENRMS